MTASQSIVRRLRVDVGDTVLVTGGNGGVGGFAVQLAAHAGARVVATASSRFDRVEALGADLVIDYRSPDADAAIREATAETGIDAIVDTVSSASATRHLALLNHTGGIACVAGRPDLAAIPAFAISPSVHEISLGAAYSAGRDKHIRDLGVMLTELLTAVADGSLDPMLSRTVGIDDIPDALEEIGTRHTVGKIVAVWD
jgi:NADPH:quinone reductase-like Zn-dependent oxidoreductase